MSEICSHGMPKNMGCASCISDEIEAWGKCRVEPNASAVGGVCEPTLRARIACSEWLASCLSFGWRKSDLDALEAIWWLRHDNQGRLT